MVFLPLVAGVASGNPTAPESMSSPATRQHSAGTKPARTADPTLVQNAGYVGTPAAPLAIIFHALEERLHLASGDRVLIDAGADKHLQVGDRLTIFRPATAVRHPLTAQALGNMVVTLGSAKILSVQASTATLQITQAFDPIQIGDYVQAFAAAPPQGTPAALPPRTIAGLIAATKDEKVAVGPGDIVYLDRGEQHGVAVGDRFDVLQESRVVRHPVSSQLRPVPRQILGSLTVIDVRNRTATALITAGQREFSVGTPVALSSTQPGDQVAVAPQVGAELTAQVEAGLAQLQPCLNAARQAIHAATAAGVPVAELAAAQNALARAELLFNQAQQALAQEDYEQAIRLLDTAQADCLTAQDLSAQAQTLAAGRAVKSDQYRVQRGDTLWGISAKPMIYANPLMWPLIYQANRQQLRDPDLIFPRQLLAIPRGFSAEQARLAIQRARQRGRWRLHDGADPFVLEGVRR
jgi:hypothetical protein